MNTTMYLIAAINKWEATFFVTAGIVLLYTIAALAIRGGYREAADDRDEDKEEGDK